MEVNKLSGDSFYTEFTLRNAGFITDEEQQVLRRSNILVAGCGSTGGSVIELLVRSGAENLILIDNGSYELNNANRQNMTIDDVDRYKPEVFKERCEKINPFVNLEICNIGITPDNVEDYVSRSDIVIDAIDVTGRSGLEMKYLLHVVCQRQRKAVICGYDMAATQYIPLFDYRNGDLAVLDNQINAEMVATMDPLKVCTFLVPIESIPEAMFEELQRSQEGKDYTSQLGIAAHLFGTITTGLVIDMLNNRDVKKDYTIDVWKVIRGEYENQEALKLYREGLKQWQGEPCNIEDKEFLKRSIRHYDAPCLPELMENELKQHAEVLNEKSGLVALYLPQSKTPDALARKLLRYAFVAYARVGFINQKVAFDNQFHHEPLESLSDDDGHIIILNTLTTQILAYSTLKAPIALDMSFSDSARPNYSVETAFDRGIYDGVSALDKYKTQQIREIGRVVKTPLEDSLLAAKSGIMLLSAYRKIVTDPKFDIQAFVGDGEEKVTLTNLSMFGFNPVILEASEIKIPQSHLYSSRYEGRDVYPFWLEVSGMDLDKSDEVESLLDLDDEQFAQSVSSMKKNTEVKLATA